PQDNQAKEILKPKQCPNCNEPNKPDGKFCAKCRMVLTYDACSETVEEKEQKDNEIQNLKQQMMSMQESQKEILDLLKDPLKLMEVLKES
ncbi:MAG: zinc ribbon domain-containing protein, partial [Candidatus Nitrosopolaris sp.]